MEQSDGNALEDDNDIFYECAEDLSKLDLLDDKLEHLNDKDEHREELEKVTNNSKEKPDLVNSDIIKDDINPVADKDTEKNLEEQASIGSKNDFQTSSSDGEDLQVQDSMSNAFKTDSPQQSMTGTNAAPIDETFDFINNDSKTGTSLDHPSESSCAENILKDKDEKVPASIPVQHGDTEVLGASSVENLTESSEKEVGGANMEKDSDDESSEEENESTLTEAELEERKMEGKKLKDEGNNFYKNGDFNEAERLYTEALKICPKCFEKERSVMYSNRSACLVKAEKTEPAIADCTKAIELHPTYVKAISRRAQLYEKLEKFEEALKDYERLLELDPSMHTARIACLRIPGEIEKRNEKLKAQMMSSLKDLGNMFLRPFGLSTNNFQLQQDPGTGSYNIQFNNSPGGANNNNGPTNGRPDNGPNSNR